MHHHQRPRTQRVKTVRFFVELNHILLSIQAQFTAKTRCTVRVEEDEGETFQVNRRGTRRVRMIDACIQIPWPRKKRGRPGRRNATAKARNTPSQVNRRKIAIPERIINQIGTGEVAERSRLAKIERGSSLAGSLLGFWGR